LAARFGQNLDSEVGEPTEFAPTLPQAFEKDSDFIVGIRTRIAARVVLASTLNSRKPLALFQVSLLLLLTGPSNYAAPVDAYYSSR
jgi:hypothetical protein